MVGNKEKIQNAGDDTDVNVSINSIVISDLFIEFVYLRN